MELENAKKLLPKWVLPLVTRRYGEPKVLAGRALTGRVWRPLPTQEPSTLALPTCKDEHNQTLRLTLEHCPAVNDLRRAAFYPARVLLEGEPIAASVLRYASFVGNTLSRSDTDLYVGVRWFDAGPLLALSKSQRAGLTWKPAERQAGLCALLVDETLSGAAYNTFVYVSESWELTFDPVARYVLVEERSHSDTSA